MTLSRRVTRQLMFVKAAIAVAVFASASGILAQTNGPRFHDLTALASRPFGAATGKPLVTPTGSILFAELSPEYRQRPHHHEQEQIHFVLSGDMDVMVGGELHHLPPLSATIPPSNVAHFMTNNSGKPTRFLEYQPVERADWLGTPNAAAQKQSPEPVSLPRGVQVSNAVVPKGAPGADGLNKASFAGRSVRVTVWETTAGQPQITVEPPRSSKHRFLYVVEGRAVFSAGAVTREIGPDVCVEFGPAVATPVLRGAGVQRTVIAMFEALD